MGGDNGAKDKSNSGVKVELVNPPKKGIWKICDYLFPTFLLLVLVSYGGFLYNPDRARSLAKEHVVLKPMVQFFDLIEIYSPFHEFINDLDSKEVR